MTWTPKTETAMLQAAPEELKKLHQWGCWRTETVKDRPTKLPYRSDGGGKASTTDLVTWSSYEAAIKVVAGYDGLGFVFCATDPYTGIDLDHCRNNETGAMDTWAQDIISKLNSYTEITPSGTGVHIFVKAKLPPGGNRKGPVEMYDQARYFTVTGNHLAGTPTTIETRQQELNDLHAETFSKPAPSQVRGSVGQPVNLDDAELIKRAMNATNGEAFTRLWNGDTSAHGGDDSAADLALCGHLAFWTGNDESRINTLFKHSGLYRPKWDRKDYSTRTVTKSCGSGNTYQSYSEMGGVGGRGIRGRDEIDFSDTKTGRERDESGTRRDEAGRGGTNGTNGTNGTTWDKLKQRGGKAVLRAWIDSADGMFDIKNVYGELGVQTAESKHYCRRLLRELIEERVIAPTPRDGTYRKVDSELIPMNWQSADITNTVPIKFPFDLHRWAKIYPRSIVVVAGSKNAGKTEFQNELVVKNMNGPLPVDLFVSETGEEQMKERMAAFNVPVPAPFKTFSRMDHFGDVIHPEHLSVIDYMDLNSEVYLIGAEIDAIFRKLTTGVAVIAIQKAPPIVTMKNGVKKLEDRDLGYGGAFSAKRAVLYISMGDGRLKLVYVKTPANPRVNPNNKCWTFSYGSGGHFVNIREANEPMGPEVY